MARLVAYQHEVKLLKYATASLHLCHQEAVTQRQVQVVAGGLVYMSMSLPGQCRLEMLRFLCLIPLAVGHVQRCIRDGWRALCESTPFSYGSYGSVAYIEEADFEAAEITTREAARALCRIV